MEQFLWVRESDWESQLYHHKLGHIATVTKTGVNEDKWRADSVKRTVCHFCETFDMQFKAEDYALSMIIQRLEEMDDESGN